MLTSFISFFPPGLQLRGLPEQLQKDRQFDRVRPRGAHHSAVEVEPQRPELAAQRRHFGGKAPDGKKKAAPKK